MTEASEAAVARQGAAAPDSNGAAREPARHASRSDYRANRRRVLQTLLDEGPVTRAHICEETGLSRATVSGLVNHFLRSGTVEESPAGSAPSRAGGRPPMLVRLSSQAGVVVGAGAGANRDLVVSVASLGHQLLHQVSVPGISPDASVHTRVARLSDAIRGAVHAAGVDFDDSVLGVSLGVAAPVTGPKGQLPQMGIDPYGQVPAPAEALSNRLHVPVLQENDANLGALAEGEWGAARGAGSFLFLLTGYGVGAGLVMDGTLHKGAWGTAGEIGHMPVRARGDLCRCGNRGCLDTVAGGGAMLSRLVGQGLDVTAPADIVRLAATGNSLAREQLHDSAFEVGTVLAGVVNLLNPERVVVGGAFADDADYLTTLRERIAKRSLRSAQERLTVLPTSLGNAATSLGGVAYLIRQPSHSGVAARLRSLTN